MHFYDMPLVGVATNFSKAVHVYVPTITATDPIVDPSCVSFREDL